MINAQEKIANSLNQAITLSPSAIRELITTKVECSKDLMDFHPTIAVACELDGYDDEIYTVSVMSLINAVLTELGHGKVAGVFEEADCDFCDDFCTDCNEEGLTLAKFVAYHTD
jgi:hypothetical protein